MLKGLYCDVNAPISFSFPVWLYQGYEGTAICDVVVMACIQRIREKQMM